MFKNSRVQLKWTSNGGITVEQRAQETRVRLLQKNPGHFPSSESTNAKLGVGGGGREGSEKP